MVTNRRFLLTLAAWVVGAATACPAQTDAPLPRGVKAVWDLDKAYRQKTSTRQRVCLNGLWRWRPAEGAAAAVPAGGWGYFKVPGCWPGITNYMQKDCQTVHAHPSWRRAKLRGIIAAWYQREISIDREWAGRRITVYAEYLNSHAAVYLDGKKAGQMRFPSGEVDITPLCRPGGKHMLTMLVTAMPLKGVMLSYSDTASAKKVKGTVDRRGLCGDVYLVAAPADARIADVKVDTSTRKWRIALDVALEGLAGDARYALRARISDNGRSVRQFTSKIFGRGELKDGRIALGEKWKPAKLWDIHTPQNVYHLELSLLDAGGKVLDAALPVRFGFREFWIDGRDFFLNGSRIFLSCVPFDNAHVSAALASYAGATESLLRLKSFGINCVYTHNYGCQPGSHLGFAEALKAADDAGMLVSFSQPHFGHYDWRAPDADRNNGDFTLDIRKTYKKMFTRWRLDPLDEKHPIYNLRYKPTGAAGLFGASNGARLLGIHSPRQLSLALQLGPSRTRRPWFELLANIYLFTTDKALLRPRGSNPWPAAKTFTPAATVRLARLKYKGNYEPEPLAMERLAVYMANRYRIKLIHSKPIDIDAIDAAAWPVAHMTGTGAFTLTPEQRAGIKKYLAAGGSLVIDAAGGSKTFADAVTEQIIPLVGGGKGSRLDLREPLYRAVEPIDQVRYRRWFAAALGNRKHQPRLRGFRIGDRLAVIYSPDDLTVGLLGCEVYNIRGYAPASAADLMTNIICHVSGVKLR